MRCVAHAASRAFVRHQSRCAVLCCAVLPTAWPCATVVYRRLARHVAHRTHAGLAFLHNARCFHGDLTPNNLMIRGRHCGRPRPPSGPISHPRACALQHTNRHLIRHSELGRVSTRVDVCCSELIVSDHGIYGLKERKGLGMSLTGEPSRVLIACAVGGPVGCVAHRLARNYTAGRRSRRRMRQLADWWFVRRASAKRRRQSGEALHADQTPLCSAGG
jgi:serine/threonine protein kinase